jgi:hypothetical protein
MPNLNTQSWRWNVTLHSRDSNVTLARLHGMEFWVSLTCGTFLLSCRSLCVFRWVEKIYRQSHLLMAVERSPEHSALRKFVPVFLCSSLFAERRTRPVSKNHFLFNLLTFANASQSASQKTAFYPTNQPSKLMLVPVQHQCSTVQTVQYSTSTSTVQYST